MWSQACDDGGFLPPCAGPPQTVSAVMSGRDHCSNSQLNTCATAPPTMAAIYDDPLCVPASISVTHWPGIACNGAGPFPVSWNYVFGESSSLSLLYSNPVCVYSSCIGVPLQDVQVFTFTPGTLPGYHVFGVGSHTVFFSFYLQSLEVPGVASPI